MVDKSLSATSGTASATGVASAGVAGAAAAAKAEPSASAFTLASAPVPSEGLSRLGAVHKTNYARHVQ